MSKGSFKVWAIMEHGYEHGTLRGVRTLRRDADAYAKHLQRNHDIEAKQQPHYFEPLRFVVVQTDLVTHDGAHALHAELYKAVGKNHAAPGNQASPIPRNDSC